MNDFKPFHRLLITVALISLGGCTVHPPGERQERQTALSAGKPYEKPVYRRTLPTLTDHPTPDDLVRYALLTNADLEKRYWQWRSAIEQVPIDGTQSTSLAISLGTTLNNGSIAWDHTVLTASNDPMTDIAFPGKLSTAARRSLENARAVGLRFRKAQFELRRKILDAYDDYAQTAEMIRLDEENIQLLQTTATITQARDRSGLAGQQDLLKARNEVDMANNDVENLRSQLPIEQAALNALMNRCSTAAISVPEALPATQPVIASDQDLLDLAAKANPELIAQADEIRAKHEDIHLAKLQYYPDFDLAASTDLQGITQTLMGEFTVPILRYEALRAAVQQAEDNLRAADAMRRQTKSDLSALIVDDITTLRDADRQLDFLAHTVMPRSRQIVALARMAYQTGNASLLDMLDSQRSLIEIERLMANLESVRDKRLSEIESLAAKDLESF